MKEQILLGSMSFDGVREKGGFGQPLHALYPQIRAVLITELGADAEHLLAEPVVDRVHNRIDWYTEGNPDQPPVALSELADEQRTAILAQVHNLLERGRSTAERYIASGDPRRVQLGAILQAVLGTPEATQVFLVDDRPVIAHWSFSTDRPWLISGLPGDHTNDPLMVPESLRPTATPDSTTPIGKSSPTPPESLALPAESPPLAPLDLSDLPQEAAGSPPTTDTDRPVLLPPAPAQSPANNPDTQMNSKNTRSGYFWALLVLLLLLVLAAAFWIWAARTPAPPLAGKTVPTLKDPASHRVPTDVQQIPAPGARPSDSSASPPTLSANPPSVASGASSPLSAPASTGIRPQTPTIPATAPAAPDAVVPAPVDSATIPATPKPAVPRPVDSAATHSQAANETPPAAEAKIRDAALPDTASPKTGATRPPVTPDTARPTAPVTRDESLAQVLENELRHSGPAKSLPPAESAYPPPVQQEPTAEERQEFLNRLSATGAETGEITATLLWDSDADLDLVVHCPSGPALDYLSPEGCGGTLDVDANAARTRLSERPVENVFWPAGQATPGTYKIMVRYEPRKDERSPRSVPFQVRLIRDGQEQVFKGTIDPHRSVQVTQFTAGN